MDEVFDWSRVLMNELPYTFLFEVIFRVFVMFTILLIFLRLAGKRTVKQLSIFELVIIIALGSAVGDPMLYDNVGILPGILVVIVVITLYRFLTLISAKIKWLEIFLEGKPKCLIRKGEFVLDNFDKENLSQDEFFSELRMRSVSHLGQIEFAYLEKLGDISIFFVDDSKVAFGLPILPELFDKRQRLLSRASHYACTFCGHISYIEKNSEICKRCQKDEWVEAINTTRKD